MRGILSRQEAVPCRRDGPRRPAYAVGGTIPRRPFRGILNSAEKWVDNFGRAPTQVSSIPEKNKESSAHRPTSCPKCGFDIEPGKPCQVCGYTPSQGSSTGTPSAGASSTAAATRKRRPGALLALLLSAGGLLILLGVFIVTNEIRPQSSADTAQASQPADLSSANAAAAEQPAQPPAGTLEGDGTTITADNASPQASAGAMAAQDSGSAGQAAGTATAPGTGAAAGTAAQPARLFSGTSSIVLSGPAPAVPFDVATRTDNPPFDNKEAFVDWMASHTDQKASFLQEKWDRAQIAQRLGNFTHERVREAFLRTPREYFSRDPRRAYENVVLPIGYGQTISGPHLVARMTDYLDPMPEQKVLEIGTGSGYQSALLSEISNHVFTIEIVEKLARKTNAIFQRLEPSYPEYRNIKRKVDDGYYGWAEYAPFDRIIVTCGIDHVPPALIKQLAPGGIMVIPIGPPSGQTILRIVKKVAPDGMVSLEREDIYHGKHKQIFVPFTARGGGIHRADDQKN